MTETVEEEFWDIYTKDREKTGRVHRRGDEMKEGEFHLVVHVCIFNSKNQMLIQHRQPFKKGWPNMWDLTAGGSALQGENSRQAAERELFEEIGLKLDLSGTRADFSVSFDEGFDDYYLLEQDVDLSQLCLQEEEVQEVRWAGREEVLAMQKQGMMIPYWFLDQLFVVRNMCGAHGNSKRDIQIRFASMENLPSWMNLVEIVRSEFSGLETETGLADCRRTVIQSIEHRCAVCALRGHVVVGMLLLPERADKSAGRPVCMVVHPDYRGRGISEDMVSFCIEQGYSSQLFISDVK